MRYRIEQLGGVLDIRAEAGGMFGIYADISQEGR